MAFLDFSNIQRVLAAKTPKNSSVISASSLVEKEPMRIRLVMPEFNYLNGSWYYQIHRYYFKPLNKYVISPTTFDSTYKCPISQAVWSAKKSSDPALAELGNSVERSNQFLFAVLKINSDGSVSSDTPKPVLFKAGAQIINSINETLVLSENIEEDWVDVNGNKESVYLRDGLGRCFTITKIIKPGQPNNKKPLPSYRVDTGKMVDLDLEFTNPASIPDFNNCALSDFSAHHPVYIKALVENYFYGTEFENMEELQALKYDVEAGPNFVHLPPKGYDKMPVAKAIVGSSANSKIATAAPVSPSPVTVPVPDSTTTKSRRDLVRDLDAEAEE